MSGLQKVQQTAVRVLIAAAVMFLPLKFGTLFQSSEVSFYPLSSVEWLLSPWPPILAAVLAGFLLLCVAITYPLPRLRSWPWALVGVWLLLFAGSLPGLIHTTEMDAVVLFMWHLLGTAAFAAAIIWAAAFDKRLAGWLLVALTLGTLWVSLLAWHATLGGGLRETLEYAEEMARLQGRELPVAIRNRLMEGRASASFVYPNSLAAHLVLTAPLVLVSVWRWAGRFEPARVSRVVLTAGTAILVGGALLMTGSRAAMVACGGGLIGALFIAFGRRRRVLIVALALAVLAAGAVLLVNRGRTLSSLDARLGYWEEGVRMFAAHPLAGVGIGEFFPYYSRMKAAAAEQTRLPHNVAVLFAAQSGVAGLLAVLAFLSMPLWVFVRNENAENAGSQAARFAVSAGMLAWCLHALTDFDFHIPATVMLLTVLPVIAGLHGGPGERAARGRWVMCLATAALTAVTLLALLRLPGEAAYCRLQVIADSAQADIDEVQAYAQRAARRLPFSPYPLLVLAERAEKDGQFEIAAEAYEESLRRAPHRGSVWYRLAACRLRLGRPYAAEAAYHNGLIWAPGSAWREQVMPQWTPETD